MTSTTINTIKDIPKVLQKLFRHLGRPIELFLEPPIDVRANFMVVLRWSMVYLHVAWGILN